MSTISLIVKLLYSLTKAENFEIRTYLDHRKSKLGMKISQYKSCIMITKNVDKNFGIVKQQMDNILNVKMHVFMIKED